MKNIKMMYLRSCPYCKQAFQMVDDLKRMNPKFQNISIELIEENEEPEKIKGYDYWYVPTYFVDDQKIHEGVPTLEAIRMVLEAAE